MFTVKIALFLTALALLILTVDAVNVKKDYCSNQEYVGNRGSKYPHLHCGKNFLTLSRSKTRHVNDLHKYEYCNKLNEILKDWQNYYGGAADSKAITEALKLCYEDLCTSDSNNQTVKSKNEL